MKTYTYNRKDGGTTDCYGELAEDSNIVVTCNDEYSDFIWTENDLKSWYGICAHLENSYNSQVEELSAVWLQSFAL